jgi:ATP-binding cassette subfamily F protein uup
LDRIVTSVVAPAGDGRWVEYAGGYSDMLALRKGDDLRKADRESSPPVSRKPASEGAKAPASKAKLSFKEKHALSTLPGEIAELESEIKTLSSKLADTELYTRDRAAFDAASARIAEAQKRLDGAETEWLELEEKRAEIEDSAK